MAVRDAHDAAARAVAGNRAVLGHERAPEERHQALTARLGCRSPVALVRPRVLDLCAASDRRPQHVEVESAENLLRPNTVERNEDDVARLGGRRCRLTLCPSTRSRDRIAVGENEERDNNRADRATAKPASMVCHGR